MFDLGELGVRIQIMRLLSKSLYALPVLFGLRRLAASLPREHGRRWSCNMLLNKWLEYCAGSGHRFALPAP
jgi:hypothetical protein